MWLTHFSTPLLRIPSLVTSVQKQHAYVHFMFSHDWTSTILKTDLSVTGRLSETLKVQKHWKTSWIFRSRERAGRHAPLLSVRQGSDFTSSQRSGRSWLDWTRLMTASHPAVIHSVWSVKTAALLCQRLLSPPTKSSLDDVHFQVLLTPVAQHTFCRFIPPIRSWWSALGETQEGSVGQWYDIQLIFNPSQAPSDQCNAFLVKINMQYKALHQCLSYQSERFHTFF